MEGSTDNHDCEASSHDPVREPPDGVDTNESGEALIVEAGTGSTCPRCKGLMMPQEYVDMSDDTGQIRIVAWHCAICGNVVDPVILKNRVAPLPNLIYGAKQRKFGQALNPSNDESST